MLLRISPLLIGFSLLAACSGSAGRYLQTGGTMCAPGFAPLTLTIAKATKVSIEPADGNLLAGQYAYDGADIFYFNPQTNQRIYFQDVYNARTKTFTTAPVCVSGLLPGQETSASITGINSMVVQSSTKSTFDVREYAFVLKNNSLERTAKDATTSVSTPSKVFDNNMTQYNLYKKDETHYELRVEAVSPTDGAQMWLAIRYVKSLIPEVLPGDIGG